jgi:hypothetical protein
LVNPSKLEYKGRVTKTIWLAQKWGMFVSLKESKANLGEQSITILSIHRPRRTGRAKVEEEEQGGSY